MPTPHRPARVDAGRNEHPAHGLLGQHFEGGGIAGAANRLVERADGARCLDAAGHMSATMSDERLGLPSGTMDVVRRSLERQDPALY